MFLIDIVRREVRARARATAVRACEERTHWIPLLQAAIKAKKKETTAVLLQHGASVFQESSRGLSPMNYAIRADDGDATALLVEASKIFLGKMHEGPDGKPGSCVFMCNTHAKCGISIQEARTVNRYSKDISANS